MFLFVLITLTKARLLLSRIIDSLERGMSPPLRFLFVSLFVPFLIFSRVSFSCFKLFCFSRKIRRSLSSSSGCTRHPFSLFARLSFSGCFILNLTPGTPLCPEALSLPLLYVQRFLLDPRHAARTPFLFTGPLIYILFNEEPDHLSTFIIPSCTWDVLLELVHPLHNSHTHLQPSPTAHISTLFYFVGLLSTKAFIGTSCTF